MKINKPLAQVVLFAAIAAPLTGCSDSTDVPKDLNDAYHNKVAPKMPADAMKGKGPSFVGQPMSTPLPGGGTAPGGPPPSALKGPATAAGG